MSSRSTIGATPPGRPPARSRAAATGGRIPIEALEPRKLLASVVSFTLIDAASDRELMTLSNGSTIDFAALGTTRLNIRADVDSGVESVRFSLDGVSNFRTENSVPYSLAGDTDGSYKSWTPAAGTHTITATPFAADDAGGAVSGTPITVAFTVVAEAPLPEPPAAPTGLLAIARTWTTVVLNWTDASQTERGFEVERSDDGGNSFSAIATVNPNQTSYIDGTVVPLTSYVYRVVSFNGAGTGTSAMVAVSTPGIPEVTTLTLVDADTDQDIMPLTDGAVLDFALLPTRNLSVRADANHPAQRVKFGLNGNPNYRVEGSRPFALAGDANGDYNPWRPGVGSYALTITPLSGNDAAGPAVIRAFTIIDNTPAPAAPSELVAVPISDGRVTITWRDNSSNETGFEVERSSDGSSWQQIGSAAAVAATGGTTSFIVYGMSPSALYYLRVRAYNTGGKSDPSNLDEIVTDPPGEQVPLPPQPGPHNTGPTDESALSVFTGLYRINVDGAVVENIEVHGEIIIEADDVTLRNFRVIADSHYGINVEGDHSGIVIEDGEVTGAGSAGLTGGGFTARRLELHHFGSDAIKPGDDVVVESCWIHHLGMTENSHADGVQIVGGVTNAVFRGNFFDMPHGDPNFRHNSVFIIDTETGPVDGIMIERNWINGGGWTMHIVGSVTNVVVHDNLFGRNYGFGVKRVEPSTTWANNRWWDTLQPIGL